MTEADGQSAWSAPIWVTTQAAAVPPAAFNLTAPANNATNQPVSGTLSWQASTGATGYDVYLGTSSPGTLVSTNQAGTTFNYSSLSYNTPYFWKVVAKNGSGNTDATSSPWTFSTVIAPPGAFTLSSPATDAVNQPIAGTLSWNASAGAVGYDVYLSTSTPPAALVSAGQPGTTYNYSGLDNNTTYFWKVVAKNSTGNTDATAVPWNFTTIVAAPGAFTQSTPASGAVNQPVAGTLSWVASGNAATYDVYLDTNAIPTTRVSAGQAAASYNYSGLANSTTYRWKIVAKNVADTLVASNAPTSFTTVMPAPGAFSLLAPANSATGQLLSGTLRWASAPGAANYDVYLDTSAAPTTVVSAAQTDTTYAYSGVLGSTTYRWKVVAKNVGGSTAASVSPFEFATANVPVAPSLLASSSVTTGSLHLSWQDNATDETGYRVYRSLAAGGPFSQIGSDLPANTASFNDAGLALNERYYYRIVPFNGTGEGAFAAINLSTLAADPGALVLSEPTFSSLRVTLDPGLNPAATQFAIRAVSGTDTLYAQANNTGGATPAWKTFTEWGGGAGTVISSLPGCREYAVTAQARNLDAVATSYSPAAAESLTCFGLSGSVQSGWNLVSLPVIVPDPHKSAVFPTSTSNAYVYQGGYQQSDSLAPGFGYWLKFASSEPVLLGGAPVTVDSIPVATGWNIIGSVSDPVPAGSILEIPPGIVASSYFGYSGGYAVADTIFPLRGYWVKASNAGTLVLSAGTSAPAAAHYQAAGEPLPAIGVLTLADGKGHAQALTLSATALPAGASALSEMPPPPPQGSFDVRFSTQRMAETLGGAAKVLVVDLQSPEPVELSWNLTALGATRLKLSFGTTVVELSGAGTISVPQGTDKIMLKEVSAGAYLPAAYALHQNYPNPFNPSTEIRYELPVRSAVKITVYSVLGVPVSTLVDGEQEPGFHAVSWHPQIASGMYMYRMEAVSTENPTVTFQKMTRMLYLK